jgi:hypothetical protein
MPSLSHLSSCTPTKYNLYFGIYFSAFMRETAQHRLLNFHLPNFISILLSAGRLSKEFVQVRVPL